MRTTFDVVEKIYQALTAVTAITGGISGNIYKNKRPLNSDKEDIVINCLPIPNDQLQKTIANVNIHVPNLKIRINNVEDNTQPNNPRLKAITALAIAALDITNGDYWFLVQQQNVFEDADIYSHYSNIRVEFYSINL